MFHNSSFTGRRWFAAFSDPFANSHQYSEKLDAFFASAGELAEGKWRYVRKFRPLISAGQHIGFAQNRGLHPSLDGPPQDENFSVLFRRTRCIAKDRRAEREGLTY